jgi:uncharacterized protein (TIGR03000 family)
MIRVRKRLFLPLTALMVFWLPLRACGAEKIPAAVVVRLPAAAELVIGGVKSKQQTAVREFDTPPLAPGKKFSYPLKAVWKAGDKEVTRETTIIVKAGETTEIDLLEPKLSPPNVEKIPAPELMPEIESIPRPKAEPEPIKKLEPEKKSLKPEPQPEPEKKPEPKMEPEIKPEPKPEPEKKPEPKPEPPSTSPKPRPEAPAPKGTLSLRMPETLHLQPGGTKLVPIKVIRTHCEGPVSIAFEGLPPGVELKTATVAAGKQKVYVQAAAPANAEEKECEVQVVGISGSVRQEATLKIKIAK